MVCTLMMSVVIVIVTKMKTVQIIWKLINDYPPHLYILIFSMISIIIPVYNRRRDLEKCLSSIRGQHFEGYEIIVVDDNSSERLDDLLDDGDTCIRNNINLGPAYSRNLASLRAKGEILLFLDSDVELLAESLGRVEAFLSQHRDIGCLGGSGPPDTDGGDVRYIKTKYYNKSGRNDSVQCTELSFMEVDIIECDHIESAFMAVPKFIFKELGGFDPYWFYMGEDREFCIRVKRAGYRVVACWETRAIHYEKDFERKISKPFQRFLTERFFEVAYKLDGLKGAIRWLATNHEQSKYLFPWKIFRIIGRLRAVGGRRNKDFLDRATLDAYIQTVRGRCAIR